jgi:hypothetical protein
MSYFCIFGCISNLNFPSVTAGLAVRKGWAAEGAPVSAAAVGHRAEQDAALSAAALAGLLIEGLIGPLAPDATGRERAIVQSLTLLALRALGVADARARGLVVSGISSQASGNLDA